MLVTTLDWSDYVGRIAVGRIQSGRIVAGQQVALMQSQRHRHPGKAASVFVFDKLGRREVAEATAGDVAAVVGLDNGLHRRHDQRSRASARPCRG